MLAWSQIAMDYTESQVADILHLRRLLFRKQGQLARERRALLSKIECSSTEGLQNAGEKFSELTQCSEQLRQNGAMEYRAYIEYCGAYHAGVSPVLCHTHAVHNMIHMCTASWCRQS